MSTLNHSDIAEAVRRRFALPEGAELQFIPLVDSALRQLSYDVARDPDMRDWLTTDPLTTTVTLDGDGVADLSALIADPRILLETLCYGDVLPPTGYPSTQPMRMLNDGAVGLLSGGYDALIYKYWLQGNFLHTKSPDNNVTPLVGDIRLAVNFWATLGQLPETLVEKLVWGNWWSTGESKSQNAA